MCGKFTDLDFGELFLYIIKAIFKFGYLMPPTLKLENSLTSEKINISGHRNLGVPVIITSKLQQADIDKLECLGLLV